MRFIIFSALVGGSLFYLASSENQSATELWEKSKSWLNSHSVSAETLGTEKDMLIETLQLKLAANEETIINLQEKLTRAQEWAEASLEEIHSKTEETADPAYTAEASPVTTEEITAAENLPAFDENLTNGDPISAGSLDQDAEEAMSPEFMTDKERAKELRRLIDDLHFKAAR